MGRFLIEGITMRKIPECPRCKSVEFKHVHNAAHGLEGTHMSGSERFECQHCNRTIYKDEGTRLGFKFNLD
jgi:transposase-like protein